MAAPSDYLRLSVVEGLLRLAFAFSIAAMIFLAFIWPIAVDPDRSDPTLRTACLHSFATFIAAMIGRLAIRVHQQRSTRSDPE
jgi:uncharacterized BrkB/YihY/UPF0761 family membrane protein